MESGLKPAVKNRAMHGGEECAARMVKTKADALGIGRQTPILLSKPLIVPTRWLLSFWFNDRAFLSNTPLSPRKSAGVSYIFRLFPGFRLRLHPGLLFCRPPERALCQARYARG